MYRTNADFVFTVTRDFVRTLSDAGADPADDVPAHPYAVAMEAAMLAPNAQVSIILEGTEERIPLAVRHIRSFLRAHRPVRRGRPAPRRSPTRDRGARWRVRTPGRRRVLGAFRLGAAVADPFAGGR